MSSARRDRFLPAAIAATAAVVAAGTAAQLVDHGLQLESPWLNSSGDGGLFGGVGDVALVLAALAAAALAMRTRPLPATLAVLPVALVVLAFDKTLRIHDDIANWRLYYLPLLVLAFAALLDVGRRLDSRSLTLMSAGVALLCLAFGIHAVGDAVMDRVGVAGDSWGYQVKTVTKHGAEVAGWLLIATGLTHGVRRRRP